CLLSTRPPRSALFPYTTLFRSPGGTAAILGGTHGNEISGVMAATVLVERAVPTKGRLIVIPHANNANVDYDDGFRSDVPAWFSRSEEHTSELQSRENLVCRLLL